MKESFVKRALDSKHTEAVAVLVVMTLIGIVLAVVLLPKKSVDPVCEAAYINQHGTSQCDDLNAQKTYDYNNR